MANVGNPNWVRGVSGNPKGRIPSSHNRVQVVWDAVRENGRKVIEQQRGKKSAAMASETECIQTWLQTLDANMLAGLYGKLLPRDINLDAHITTAEQVIQQLEAAGEQAQENMTDATQAPKNE